MLCRRKKRSVDSDLSMIGTRIDEENDHLLTVLDAVELLETLDEFLTSAGISSRQCQLKTVCDLYHNKSVLDSKVDSLAEMVRMLVDTLHTGSVDPEVDSVTRDWTRASFTGQVGGGCEEEYQCDSPAFQSNLLRLSI